MKLAENSFESFYKETENKTLIAFGASSYLSLIANNYIDLDLKGRISYFIDNSAEKQKNGFYLGDKRFDVFSIDKLVSEEADNIVMLISSSAYAMEIYDQLQQISSLKNVKCFFLSYLITERSDMSDFYDSASDEFKIPKIIHCFWFSKDKKDELSQKCMDSWKRACPDYRIMEWNADNYDINRNAYMKKAFDMKKWACASDYARLDIINEYGGFYLDLDIELYHSLDTWRKHDFVIGYGPYRDVEGAAFGCVKGHKFMRELLDIYKDREFSFDKITAGEIQPVYLNRIFRQNGFTIDGKYCKKDGICIYPKEFLSDRNPFTGEIKRTEYSLGVHHCAGGWWTEEAKKLHKRSADNLYEIRKLFEDK